MKLIELHLLQSFPFTCLNRDDVGAPKTAYFGGVQRARVSSQSWKRAIRERAFELEPEYFAGKRGLFHSEALRNKLIEFGFDASKAQKEAEKKIKALTTNKEDKSKPTLLYLAPSDIEIIAKLMVEGKADKKGQMKEATDDDILDAVKDSSHLDFADLAIFGRMVAAKSKLTLEGAGMFAHALSTHEAANEIDFFSAVDDTKPTDDAGAGHIGVLEAKSACYYRYIGLNVDLLFDDAHLGKVEKADREAALKAFLRAALEAVPKARKNSMFGYSLPEYALGLVRKGQPLSLVNAFETPVRVKSSDDGGYLEKSVEALEKHRDKLNAIYGLQKQVACEAKLSEDKPLDAWIEEIVAAALGE